MEHARSRDLTYFRVGTVKREAGLYEGREGRGIPPAGKTRSDFDDVDDLDRRAKYFPLLASFAIPSLVKLAISSLT